MTLDSKWFYGVLLLCLVCGVQHVAYGKKKTAKQAQMYLFPSLCSLQKCLIKGWIVRRSRWLSFSKKSSSFRSMMRGIRRFTRKGLAGARIELRFAGQIQQVVADKYGFFQATFVAPKQADSDQARVVASSWKFKKRAASTTRPSTQPSSQAANTSFSGVHVVQARLIRALGRWPFRRPYAAPPVQGWAVRPLHSKGLSVISDIDDTLIASHVKKKLKLVKTFLFRRFDQIRVFPKSLFLVKQLLRGPQGRGGGTVHYVTGSPAVIYDRLFRLFRLRSFPIGSMHMKRLRGKKAHGALKHLQYKINHIRSILAMYPKRRFILIGDSGEKDPEVYAAIRKAYPQQIAGIFIHSVGLEWPKSPRFKGMFVFKKYAEAVRHARTMRWIR